MEEQKTNMYSPRLQQPNINKASDALWLPIFFNLLPLEGCETGFSFERDDLWLMTSHEHSLHANSNVYNTSRV